MIAELRPHQEAAVSGAKQWVDLPRAHLAESLRSPVRSIHYLDADRLGPGPVVLSGSGAPWEEHDPADLARLGDAVRASDAPVLGICAIQAIAAPERGWWGTQFHPERFDAKRPDGRRVIANFFDLVGEEPA